MKLYTLLFVLLSVITGYSQSKLSGIVLDSKTKEPLPFVNISANNSKYGTSTDIDGRFKINYKVSSLQFSFVGYEKQSIEITNQSKLTILLKEKSFNLKGIVINPEENPALRIIRNVIKNRKLNDAERKDYTCNLYNKFTINMFEDTNSSLFKEQLFDKKTIRIKDSANQGKFINKVVQLDSIETAKNRAEEIKDIIYMNNTPMMLLETYVDKKHKAPNQNKELITASKMSGLKNPLFLAMLTKIQSFSFYTPTFDINGSNFVSPISKSGIKKYFYLIEDTLYENSDTVFVISYRPYKGKVFNGMKGVMQISTNKFGLKNVIAQPADTTLNTQVVIQQLYEEDSLKNWIPKQLLGKLTFGMLTDDDGLEVFGETKTYISNFDYISRVKYGDIDNLAFEIDPDAHLVDSTEWAQLRPIKLTTGESFTLIDSIQDSIPINLDNLLVGAKILMTGKLPYKFINIDLDKILDYNSVEGLRIGLGLHTNRRVSKYVSTGGYFAYGIKDKVWKYGGDLNFNLSKRNDIDFNISYKKDVVSSGKQQYFKTNTAGGIIPTDFSKYFINKMDDLTKYEAYLSFRTLKHFKLHAFGNIQTRTVRDDYLFNRIQNEAITVGEQTHFISEYGVEARFAFRETFYFDGEDRFSFGTKFPIVTGRVSFGFPSNYGNLTYTKYDLIINDDFKIGRIGKSNITVQAGLVDGNIPYTLLYNPDGVFTNFSISADNSFETMRVNEFLSNKFINIFFRHQFPDIRITKKIVPNFELVHNIGYGSLEFPGDHVNTTFKTLDNGFWESGLRLNNLLKINITSIGFGTYFRYGANSLTKMSDNFAYKFVVKLKL